MIIRKENLPLSLKKFTCESIIVDHYRNLIIVCSNLIIVYFTKLVRKLILTNENLTCE